jgi:prepilin-type N-terminal cleavage/methylation domain-containing protein
MKAIPSAPAATFPRAASSRAFTLIELLTVIAIIGILAAIIIPTVGKVRESARKAKSVSNLHAIYAAIITHADDNKQTIVRHQVLPPQGNNESWGQHINVKGYLGGKTTQVNDNPLMGCPQHLAVIPGASEGNSRLYTYAMNTNLAAPRRLASMIAPSRTALIMNGVWIAGSNMFSPLTFPNRFLNDEMRTAPCRPPINNDVFVLFAGGNVSTVNIDTIPVNNTSDAGKLFWLGR